MLDGMCVNTMVLIRPIGGRASRHREGKGRKHARPEEEQARGAQRQIEALEEPERQQRLHDEAAGEGIEAEERRKSVDDVPRWP